MAERRFLDFLDMIDGGGAGQMGDRFEGGGLLSTLGNLVATPYGSEDERRAAARRDFYSSQDIGQPLNTTASMAAPAVAPVVRPQARPFEPNYSDRFAPIPAAAPSALPSTFYNNPNFTAPPPLDAAGQYVPPPAAAVPFEPNYSDRFEVPAPAALSFEQFVAGLGPVAQTASPGALKQAYVQHMQGYGY